MFKTPDVAPRSRRRAILSGFSLSDVSLPMCLAAGRVPLPQGRPAAGRRGHVLSALKLKKTYRYEVPKAL